jgi:Arm DNA-binding domain
LIVRKHSPKSGFRLWNGLRHGMARVVGKLSPLKVQKERRPGMYGDGAGLWLNVGPTGSKSWVFRYMLHGRARAMGIGALHTVGLADARERARAARLLLLDGIDPLDARAAQRKQSRLEASVSFGARWAGRCRAEVFPAPGPATWLRLRGGFAALSILGHYAATTAGTRRHYTMLERLAQRRFIGPAVPTEAMGKAGFLTATAIKVAALHR